MMVEKFRMYKEPELYDDIYFNVARGLNKYSKEVNAIDDLVNQCGLDKRVIDFCCGTGTHLKLFSDLGYQCTGVDINNEMLRLAKIKNKNNLSIFYQGNICDIKIKNKFPIAISMYGGFNYLETEKDVKNALTNIYSILEDDGIFILDTRWAKNQPIDVMLEKRGRDLYIVRQWVLKEPDNLRDAVYKIAFIKEGADGVLMYEEHHQNFLDPIYLRTKMIDVGFKNVKIYDNFDWEKEVNKNSST